MIQATAGQSATSGIQECEPTWWKESLRTWGGGGGVGEGFQSLIRWKDQSRVLKVKMKRKALEFTFYSRHSQGSTLCPVPYLASV